MLPVPVRLAALGVDQVRADVEAGGLGDGAVEEVADVHGLGQGDAGGRVVQDVAHREPSRPMYQQTSPRSMIS